MRRRCLQLGVAVGLVLTGPTGRADDGAATAGDPLEFFEFLGSPEADSALWVPFLDSLPDRPDESVPSEAEVADAEGERE